LVEALCQVIGCFSICLILAGVLGPGVATPLIEISTRKITERLNAADYINAISEPIFEKM
jgi:hypothetical protein